MEKACDNTQLWKTKLNCRHCCLLNKFSKSNSKQTEWPHHCYCFHKIQVPLHIHLLCMWWSPYQILKSMLLVIRRTELYNVARLNVVGGVTVKYSADLDNTRIHYTMIPLNNLISQFFLLASVTCKAGQV